MIFPSRYWKPTVPAESLCMVTVRSNGRSRTATCRRENKTKHTSALPPDGEKTKHTSALPPAGEKTKHKSTLPPAGEKTKHVTQPTENCGSKKKWLMTQQQQNRYMTEPAEIGEKAFQKKANTINFLRVKPLLSSFIPRNDVLCLPYHSCYNFGVISGNFHFLPQTFL